MPSFRVVCCTALLMERGVATTAQMVSAVATDWTAWTTVHLDSSGREYRENGNRNQWDMLQSKPCGLCLALHCLLSGVWRPWHNLFLLSWNQVDGTTEKSETRASATCCSRTAETAPGSFQNSVSQLFGHSKIYFVCPVVGV